MLTPTPLDAARVSPPGPADGGSTQANRPFLQAFSTPGTTVTLCTAASPDAAAIPFGGCYITWISDADCFVRVGTSTMNVATTSDHFLPAGVERTWWHDPNTQTHFSVLQRVGAGTLKRYRSNTVG